MHDLAAIRQINMNPEAYAHRARKQRAEAIVRDLRKVAEIYDAKAQFKEADAILKAIVTINRELT